MKQLFGLASLIAILFNGLVNPIGMSLQQALTAQSEDNKAVLDQGIDGFNSKFKALAAFEEIGLTFPLSEATPGEVLELASTDLKALADYQNDNTTASVTFSTLMSDKIPLSYLEEDENQNIVLILGGDPEQGNIDVRGRLTGTLTFHLDTDLVEEKPLQAVYLEGAPTLDLELFTVGEATSEVPGASSVSDLDGVIGYTDVTANGTALFNWNVQVKLNDPDSDGRITWDEFQNTELYDLVEVSFVDALGDDVNYDIKLDTDLITSTGTEDGTLTLQIADMTNSGLFEPEVDLKQHLGNFTNIDTDQMLIGLGSFGVSLNAAMLAADLRFPYLDLQFYDMFKPGEAIIDHVRRQGNAVIVCGTDDGDPPAGDPSNGGVIYCQAYAAYEPISIDSWTINGRAPETTDFAGTIGTDPTATVKFIGVGAGEWWDIKAVYTAEDAEGNEVQHTTIPRARTAQELEASLKDLFGEAAVYLVYNEGDETLEFQFDVTEDPDPVNAPFAFRDSLRHGTNLAHLRLDTSVAYTPTVDIGGVSITADFGTILIDDVADITPDSYEGSGDTPETCEDGEDNDGDGFVDELDSECPSLDDRFFIRVGAGDEIQVDTLSMQNVDAETFNLIGGIGFLPVRVTGQENETAFDIFATSNPVLSINIEAGEIPIESSSSIANAIRVRTLLDDSGLDEFEGPVSRAINLGLEAHLKVEDTVDDSLSLQGNIDIDWPDIMTGEPTIALDDDYINTLQLFDISPTLIGTHTGGESTDLTDAARDFLTAFGRPLQIGDSLPVELFNLRSGASCILVIVSGQNTLQCAANDENGTAVPAMMSGGNAAGLIENPADNQGTCDDGEDNDGDGNTDEADPDCNPNTWRSGDEYEIRGDPTLLGKITLDYLFEINRRMAIKADEEIDQPLPLVDVFPQNILPQFDALSLAVNEMAESDDFQSWTLNDLKMKLMEQLQSTDDYDSSSLQFRFEVHNNPNADPALPHDFLVVSVNVVFDGQKEGVHLQSSLRRENASPLSLRQDTAEDGFTLDYNSTVTLEFGIPLPLLSSTSDQDLDIIVLDGTGASLTTRLDDGNGGAITISDVAATIASTDVILGRDAQVTGAHAGDSSGTVLTDASKDFNELGIQADLVVVNTIKNASCTITDIPDTETVVCADDLKAPAGWSDGDGYSIALTGTHTQVEGNNPSTTLHHPGREPTFNDAGIIEGMTLTNTTTGATCLVTAVAADTITCDDGLSGGSEWSDGDGYSIALTGTHTQVEGSDPSTTLHHPDRDPIFNDAGVIEGMTLTNTTTGATCVITDVAADTITCADGLMTAEKWETGDEYLIDMSGVGEIYENATLNFSSASSATESTMQDFVSGLAASYTGSFSLRSSVAFQREGSQTYQHIGYVEYADSDLSDVTDSYATIPQAILDGVRPLAWSLLAEPVRQLSFIIADNMWADGLPLVGNDLMAGAEIDKKVEELFNALQSELGESPANDTVSGVKMEITDAISETTGLDPNAISVNLECSEGICLDDSLYTDISTIDISFTIGETETVYTPTFDTGLPGLDIRSEDTVESTVTWSLNVHFGLDRALGPYLDVSVGDDLTLSADVILKDNNCGNWEYNNQTDYFKREDYILQFASNRCVEGTIGLLPGVFFDGNGDGTTPDDTQSVLNLNVVLHLQAANTDGKIGYGDLLQANYTQVLSYTADANVDLGFKTNGDENFPGLVGTFHMTFEIAFDSSQTDPYVTFEYESLEYKDLYLDPGGFYEDFLSPIISFVQRFTKPLQPVVDVLTAPIPVLSAISQAVGQGEVTPLKLLEAVSGNDLTLVYKLADFISFVNNLPSGGQTNLVALGPTGIGDTPLPGAFKIDSSKTQLGCVGPRQPGRWIDVEDTTNPEDLKKAQAKCRTSGSSTGSTNQGSSKIDPNGVQSGNANHLIPVERKTNKEVSYSGPSISFPFLADTTRIFGMLVGEDTTLIRLDLGTITASVGISYTFGPFMIGPIPADVGVGGDLSISGRFAIGFDTYGLRRAIETGEGVQIFDGFFFDDFDASGEDVPEITLTASFWVEAAVSIRIIRVGARGTATIGIYLDLNDPNQDGKLRISEFSAFSGNALCLFTVRGDLTFSLTLFVEIDLWLFSKRFDWTPLSAKIDLFEVECGPVEPDLAILDGGNLHLNMGGRASERNVFTGEINEKFTVAQLTKKGEGIKCAPPSGQHTCSEPAIIGTWVSITFMGIYEEEFVPDGGMIVGDARDGNDFVRFIAGTDSDGNTVPFSLDTKVYGGPGDDRLTGGNGVDIFYGESGNDILNGYAGDDKLYGGDDDDTIEGGLGADTIYGDNQDSTGTGMDFVTGGPGVDEIYGGPGNDTLIGGPGLEDDGDETDADDYLEDKGDYLYGEAGSDTLEGGFGDDQLFGDENLACSVDGIEVSDDDARRDFLSGGDGNDEMYGGGGDDILNAGAGNDTLCGNRGNDTLQASSGDDYLNGGSGHDDLLGGEGRDTLKGEGGMDILIGDTGEFTARGENDDTLEELVALVTPANAPSGSTTPELSEEITCPMEIPEGGGKDSDCLYGGGDSDAIFGEAGDDYIEGNDSDDHLEGNAGNDQMFGGDENDTMRGGQHDDEMHGDGGDDTMFGDSGIDEMYGGANQDTMRGGKGDDNMWGGDDDDTMYGNADNDYMEGNPGADEMYGGAGNDDMIGGSANADALDADDVMYGGEGMDVLIGDNGVFTSTGVSGHTGRTIQVFNLDAQSGDTSGNDTMSGNQENDDLYGGAGEDTMHGDGGNDYVEGNPGVDTMYGDFGNDDMVGGSSTEQAWDTGDKMHGGQGMDVLVGDNGSFEDISDILLSGHTGRKVKLYNLTTPTGDTSGMDTMNGNAGDDDLYGSSDNDTMHGDDGDDYMEGNPGEDTMYGDAGQDDMIGGSSQKTPMIPAHIPGEPLAVNTYPDSGDTMWGGDGSSELPDDFDVMLGDNGAITRHGNTNYHDDVSDVYVRTMELYDRDWAPTCEANAQGGNDVMKGEAGFDRMYGQGGDDTMHGGSGDDIMEGNQGSDTLHGDAGHDDMLGGSGTTTDGLCDAVDTLHGNDDNDVMLGDNGMISRPLANDGYWLQDSNRSSPLRSITLVDILHTGESAVAGVSGGDDLYGEGGLDQIFGQGGEDHIQGGSEDDYLEGNHDVDTMYGQAGDDDMIGGSSAGDGVIGSGVRPVNLTDGVDTIYGGLEDDVMLGDNGTIDRGNPWSWVVGGGYNIAVRVVDVRNAPAGSLEDDGAFGSDTMYGNEGHDEMYGQQGDDYMEGNPGDDVMLGELGSVKRSYIGENDKRTRTISTLAPFLQAEIFPAGTLYNLVQLYIDAPAMGRDIMLGGEGRDDMHGGSGEDIMNGEQGVDHLFGGDQDDYLWGGSDNDHLFGGYDDDYLDVVPRDDDPQDIKDYGGVENYLGVDIIYGGWDADALQSNVDAEGTGPVVGDRLVDWVGAYNVYYVCQAAYGAGVIIRNPAPQVISFLQQLADADGAFEPGKAKTSGYNEVAIVYPKDIRFNTTPVHPDHPGHFTCP